MIALKPGLLLDLVLSGEVLDDPLVNLHAEFRPYDLAAPEVHHNLGLVAFFDKTIDIPDLELKIMLADLWSDFYFFDVDGLSLGVLLMELIFIFAEIEDLAYRRVCRRGYFHKIELPFVRNNQGLAHRHDAKLTAVTVDNSDLFRPDLFIYSDVFSDVPVTDVFTSWY